MATRLIIFDAEDLKNLICHYTDGAMPPLNSQVIEVGVSKYLERIISLNIESPQWPSHDVSAATGELQPYEFLYEGGHVATWTDKHQEDVTWLETPDAPRRQ